MKRQSSAAAHRPADDRSTKEIIADIHRKLDFMIAEIEGMIEAKRRTNLQLARSVIRQGYGHLVREHLPHLYYAILK